MPICHDLLLRQLERHFGDLAAVPAELLPLLEMVDATYAASGVARELPAPIPAPASVTTAGVLPWDPFSLVFDGSMMV